MAACSQNSGLPLPGNYHRTIEQGNVEQITTWLEQGYDFSSQPSHNALAAPTPLILAARLNKIEIVRRILAFMPDASAQQRGELGLSQTREIRSSALIEASFYGHVKIVELLLEQRADPTLATVDNHTPLHYAAYNGQLAVVRMLLQKNVPIDPQETIHGATPLWLATYQGMYPETVQTLLQAGANCEVRGSTLSELILKVSNDSTLLHAAVDASSREVAGSEDTIQVLLDEGVPVNATDRLGRTALHRAAANNRVSIIQKLLAANANLFAVNGRDCTPFDLAHAAGHAEAAELLSQRSFEVLSRTIKTIPESQNPRLPDPIVALATSYLFPTSFKEG